MAIRLHKPILVGGVGLSLALWLWSNWGNSALELGQLSLTGAIAFGGWLWLWQRGKKPQAVVNNLKPLDELTVKEAIATTEKQLAVLAAEPNAEVTSLAAAVAQLTSLLARQNLQIAITGMRKVGKSTLQKLLTASHPDLTIVETQPLLTQSGTVPDASLLKSDLVIFLTNGDLTDSEWSLIQGWAKLQQTILIVLNKQDQYPAEEIALLQTQLQERVKTLIPSHHVMAIAANPNPIKVRQHQADGTCQEWFEASQPIISPLTERLEGLITQHRQDLIRATTWRQAVQLQEAIKQQFHQIKAQQALPIIEQYQWLAGGTALANPVAALDLLVTVAINGQMIVDIGKIYQQQFSLSQAQTIAASLGELMVKLGLVELSTQTLTGMLKTNAFTYLAGGTVQGISAAYLTRLAGLTLIEYFQEQPGTSQSWDLEKLGAKLKAVFEQNQRGSFLQNFLQQALAKV